MTTDGVNGKQASKNNGVNPFRSTQLKNRADFGNRRSSHPLTLVPSLRLIQNTLIAPAVTPIHESINPSQRPYMLALAAMMRNNGKTGRKDSTIGSSMPGKGPHWE